MKRPVFSDFLFGYSLHVFSVEKGVNVLQYNMRHTMEQHSNVPDVKLHDQAAAPSSKLSTTYLKQNITVSHIDSQRQYERMHSSAVLKFTP
jgi:hypothetical protein